MQKRFCPLCAAPVKGTASQFEKRVSCPRCKAEVYFYNYPNTEVKLPDLSEPSRNYIPVAAVVAVISVLLLAAMFSGSEILYGLVAILLVLVSAATSAVAVYYRDEIKRREARDKRIEDIYESFHKAVEVSAGLQRNYENLKSDLAAESEFLKNRLRQQHEEKMAVAEEHAGAVQTVADRYVTDTVKQALKDITPNNLHTIQARLNRVVEFVVKKGCRVSNEAISSAHSDIELAFKDAVRKSVERERQREIQEQIREEQRVEREMQRALKEATERQTAIERAIQEALTRTKDEHSAEVEDLRRQLADAQERVQRAVSQAQLTKSGNVYVISNIGSFGESVFKIGMTRRLVPEERIAELGDASVPFPFDVHMMIACQDAPQLENAIHKALHPVRLNKVNPRKEFFRTDIETIRRIVEDNHGQVEYVATPEALQYYESQALTESELQVIDEAYSDVASPDE